MNGGYLLASALCFLNHQSAGSHESRMWQINLTQPCFLVNLNKAIIRVNYSRIRNINLEFRRKYNVCQLL